MFTPADAQQNPKIWFDQFQPWAGAHPSPDDSQWCARHWGPCPVLGANGIGAAVEMMQIFINEVAPAGAKSAADMQAALERTGKVCCKLGDQAMYDLWGKWAPAPGSSPGWWSEEPRPPKVKP